MNDERSIEIHFETKEGGFEVVASLGQTSLTLFDGSTDLNGDMDTLVAALPGILDAVAERLEEMAEEA